MQRAARGETRATKAWAPQSAFGFVTGAEHSIVKAAAHRKKLTVISSSPSHRLRRNLASTRCSLYIMNIQGASLIPRGKPSHDLEPDLAVARQQPERMEFPQSGDCAAQCLLQFRPHLSTVGSAWNTPNGVCAKTYDGLMNFVNAADMAALPTWSPRQCGHRCCRAQLIFNPLA